MCIQKLSFVDEKYQKYIQRWVGSFKVDGSREQPVLPLSAHCVRDGKRGRDLGGRPA